MRNMIGRFDEIRMFDFEGVAFYVTINYSYFKDEGVYTGPFGQSYPEETEFDYVILDFDFAYENDKFDWPEEGSDDCESRSEFAERARKFIDDPVELQDLFDVDNEWYKETRGQR